MVEPSAQSDKKISGMIQRVTCEIGEKIATRKL
jgi:hypothetical protein